MKLFATSTGTNVVFFEPGKESNTFPYEGMIVYDVCIKSFLPTFPLPIGSKPTLTDAVLLESQLKSIPMSLENPSCTDLHRVVGDKLLNLTPCQWHVLLKSVCREVGLDCVSATKAASQRKQITELINHLWIEGNNFSCYEDSPQYGMPEEESNQYIYDLLISHIKGVAPHALY